MVNFVQKDHYAYADLVEIIRILRSPEGCPWDRVQTHASLRRGLLEEAYEVAEAIDLADPAGLCEELGDLLMQVVFHASLSEDAGGFTMDDVADGVVKKLIYRHPHVFGNESLADSDAVLDRWEVLKRAEKSQQSTADAMDSVAKSLPALWRSEKIQSKAAKAGFDWDDRLGALDQLEEEIRELRQAAETEEDEPFFEELGDVLFAAVKAGQCRGLDPEAALHAACEKFTARFRRMETRLSAQGREMREIPPAELRTVWNEVKRS